MRILVDADACPVKDEIIRASKMSQTPIEVHMFIDVNHTLRGYDAKVHVVDQGPDAVDMALINFMVPQDIVVTSDYGVAAMALSKRGYVIHNNGYIIDALNIDGLMFQRHVNRKARQMGKRGGKHKKRTAKDNRTFYETLINLIEKIRPER